VSSFDDRCVVAERLERQSLLKLQRGRLLPVIEGVDDMGLTS
jgi:hypothetical protein